MKRLSMLLAFMLFSASLFAANVPFAWDYGAVMPTGFEMRLSTVAGGVPTTIFDCGPSALKTCLVLGVLPGTYYAKVFAYNNGNPVLLKEYSDSSNEVAFTVPVKPPPATNERIVAPSGSASLEFEVPEDMLATVTLTFDPKP